MLPVAKLVSLTARAGVVVALDACANAIDASTCSPWHAAQAASVILVFDEANRRAVMARHPALRRRIVMLGDLDGSGAIADPVDGDMAVFARCYARIDAAVAALAGLLRPPVRT